MSDPRRAPNLPRIHPAAWHGAIGEIVRKVAPSTEADPVAILGTTLALFGAIAGDGPWVRCGGAKHPARIWPLIIGKTGSGRKGTSLAEARSIARGWSTYADNYANHRMIFGLSSGEGIIQALGGQVGSAGDGDQQVTAPDGKLTVTETEFARTLTAAKRDGSTLGPILRQLWEDGSAAVLTKNMASVRGAHLIVVAHITPQELRMKLAEADLAGGTLNRFLLLAAERPHLIPHESRNRPDVAEPSEWLGKAIESTRFASGEIHRDRDAEDLWEAVYAALSDDEPDGHLGAVLARGPVYTMRLALAYALADGDSSIRPQHLLAGLAVWQYAADTARRLFPTGSRTDVDRLIAYIDEAGPAGRSKTDIFRGLFRANKSAEEVRALIAELQRRDRIAEDKQAPEGGRGRPQVRYRATGKYVDKVSDLLAIYGTNVFTSHAH